MKTFATIVFVLVVPAFIVVLLLDHMPAREAFFLVYGPIGLIYVIYSIVKKIKTPHEGGS